jgi:hypothetical protein
MLPAAVTKLSKKSSRFAPTYRSLLEWTRPPKVIVGPGRISRS